MWIVRWIFWVLVLLVLIFFAMENATQMVYVKFVKWRSVDLPLWVVMYGAFAVGILVWLVASIVKIIQLKSEVSKINKENLSLRKELDQLRNIPIDDDDADSIDRIGKELR